LICVFPGRSEIFMTDFSLTTGNDTIVTSSSGSTVYATAGTLNAGDSLTGGAGTDVLELVGSGTFHVDQLASFTGFETIGLNNATNTFANLTLGAQPIEVDSTGLLEIFVNSPSNWNGSDIINGDVDLSHPTYLFFNNQSFPSIPLAYDLTSNTLSHVGIVGSDDNLSLAINNSDTAGVQSFSTSGLNDQLVTGGPTLDLSHTTVSGFRVTSTNGLGTTFTVGDLGTAFQIAGGSGHDTLIAQGLTLTAAQRTEIFGTSSIETITDQTGTYTATGDTTAPSAASISSVNDDVAPVIGPISSGAVTNDPDLTVKVSLSGTGAFAGDTVQLYNGTNTGSQLGSSYALTSTDISNGFANVQNGHVDRRHYLYADGADHRCGRQPERGFNQFIYGDRVGAGDIQIYRNDLQCRSTAHKQVRGRRYDLGDLHIRSCRARCGPGRSHRGHL
jgi:hypothetical protein